jgi:hypothetical protein
VKGKAEGEPMLSGYKTITPIQFANAIHAQNIKNINARALRVYFACFALVAVREAAKRYRKARRERAKLLSRYHLSELRDVTDLSLATIKTALRELSRAGWPNTGKGKLLSPRYRLMAQKCYWKCSRVGSF